MCGRYALTTDTVGLKKRFGLRDSPLVSPLRNIPPGTVLPIIPMENPEEAVLAKWGLIPRWAKDPKIGYKMINARAETIAEKPSFRKPLVSGRCLIPASGFYEWQKTEEGKVPYYISVTDNPLFAFAGLYDVWTDPEGKRIKTFTIITTQPNTLIAPIHNRMPVILDNDTEALWLNPDTTEASQLTPLLKSYTAAFMAMEKVRPELGRNV